MGFAKYAEDILSINNGNEYNNKFLLNVRNLTGQTITSKSGRKYTLTEVAGSGAQGVVYKESTGKYMIKLYFASDDPNFNKEMLEKLAFIKTVKKPRNFVEINDLFDSPYVGYAMERVHEHKSLNSYLIPNKDKSFFDWYNAGLGFRERLFLGYIIAKAFGALAIDNLSYCDISGNNILIKVNSKEASVRMIDIDNIYIAGSNKASVLGTPRYIAPEVICKAKNPDVISDNYSLAVIIFELLRVGHPYVSDEIAEGTPDDEDAAYAGKAEYVTDNNSTNMLPTDIAFTDKLKELFKRCFVEGKKNRMERPSAKEFEYALLEASNKVIKCPSCGAWHYPRKEKGIYECPWCNKESKPKAFLNFFDRLYADGDDVTKAEPEKLFEKAVNSYILRDADKNRIKNYYVLRSESDNPDLSRASGNYITIVKKDSEYHVYNEFNQGGISVRSFVTGKFTPLGARGDVILKPGDEIYFGVIDNKAIKISCGGKLYRYIRVAKFVEDRR